MPTQKIASLLNTVRYPPPAAVDAVIMFSLHHRISQNLLSLNLRLSRNSVVPTKAPVMSASFIQEVNISRESHRHLFLANADVEVIWITPSRFISNSGGFAGI